GRAEETLGVALPQQEDWPSADNAIFAVSANTHLITLIDEKPVSQNCDYCIKRRENEDIIQFEEERLHLHMNKIITQGLHSSSNQTHIISQTSHILHSPSLIHASTFMVLLQGHENNIPGNDISGCCKFLCSCSVDGTFLVWMIELPMHPPMWFKSRDVTKQGKRSGLQREK
ncbi:MAG: hypothetical protein EZS28_045631, partial [Streblomastix strix]